MIKLSVFLPLSFFLISNAFGQSLVIKGRVRCMNQHVNSTKGAENIIVVPTFIPVKSTTTASSPSGYFEINTGIPFERLQDKQVHLYVVSKCGQCKEMAKRVFISQDQDKQNTDESKMFVTVKGWKLDANCKDAELTAMKADSMLAMIVKQPAEDFDKISSATALGASPALLNLLTTIIKAPIIAPADGIFKASKILENNISYGKFLFSSSLTHTSNTGFNFSPSRNLSEAIFWNPSAITSSSELHNISLFTNFKNNIKAGGYLALTDKISLGAGVIYTRQDEFQKTEYQRGFKVTADHLLKLDEYAIFVSSAIQLNKKASLGLALKSIRQNFNIPKTFEIRATPDGNINIFRDSSVSKQEFDVDLSFSYKITKEFQIGINIMNIAGTELHADGFVPQQTDLEFQNLRSLGIGLCYKWKRFNFGSDILFTQDDFYDATVGVNYVPFNNALLSAGFAIKQLSYSLAFKLKHFRIAYINDNSLLINEERKGKIDFFDGKIYSGLVFNF